ncbi:MraY family glycosyltransferase [Pontibacter sp. G13]|uniref:MraY family glycosyltransferase n=1 Tax=Pontibacter sp. G13 TaxID=3074898 RepID=UPI002889A47E|nr:MraY family glycosyltransferase [Pontibacter sp. G13]WNJ20388.1 MraY family glycosyltransferase [Pontibacter sp. G13]
MKSVVLLIGAVGFSYMLNKILLRFSKNFGVDSRQSQNLVRWSSTSKPTTGGISFFITFLMGSLALLILRPELPMDSQSLIALFLSTTLAFMIGFADDAYGTHPSLKFMGQVACGVILLTFGHHIEFFSKFTDNSAGLWLDYGLTIFWVVGMMNSLNMLDNMDGVTTTIALTIVVGTLTMITFSRGISHDFYLLVAVAGGFLGFLFWNWRPAKVYMGDTGSMFIGMLAAFVGIKYFWNIHTSPDNLSIIRMTAIPLMVFIVPIMDTTFVTIARIARGTSPFVGGKDHLTHNMVRVGVPEEMVPVVLGLVSMVSGLLAIFAFRLIPEWQVIYSALFGMYPVMLFGLFTYLYIKGTKIAAMREKMEQEAAEASRLTTDAQPDMIPSSAVAEEMMSDSQ